MKTEQAEIIQRAVGKTIAHLNFKQSDPESISEMVFSDGSSLQFSDGDVYASIHSLQEVQDIAKQFQNYAQALGNLFGAKAEEVKAGIPFNKFLSEDIVDQKGEMEAHLTFLLQHRLLFGQETRLLMSEVKDVRNFFLDAEHERQIAVIARTVAVLRDLIEMKKSGALDTLADTILKLSVKEGK